MQIYQKKTLPDEPFKLFEQFPGLEIPLYHMDIKHEIILQTDNGEEFGGKSIASDV